MLLTIYIIFVATKQETGMKLKYFTLFVAIFLFSATSVLGQARSRHYYRITHSKDTVSLMMASYLDSLKSIKLRLDSTHQAQVDADVLPMPSMEYSRLFVPLTFYHNVAGKWLNLENCDDEYDELDQALMDVYITRPDLVQSSQSQLDKIGPILTPASEQISPDVDIVEQVAEKAAIEEVTHVDVIVKKPNFWKFSGDYSLQLFQTYISSNWYKGGESNYSMLGVVTLQANYNNKQKFRWDNKLEMKLGFQSARADSLHTLRTSEDLLRYTGKVGLQATKKWYYTFQLIATTQFMRGYKSNDPKMYSDFLAPLTVNPSIGMDYTANWLKGHITGSIHLAPLAYNWKFVSHPSLVTSYGIEEGHHVLDDFGSEFNLNLTWAITNDIKWTTRLYGYTSYERSLIEFENTFSFRVNKYITSNLFVYPRFDDSQTRDSHHGYWMFKEYVSLGFAYSF